MPMQEEWLTVAAAAEKAGYHPEYVRDLIRDGKVKGRKWATVWQVSAESLQAYLDSMKEQGQKRGPKES
jgi:hypothetical protein